MIVFLHIMYIIPNKEDNESGFTKVKVPMKNEAFIIIHLLFN